MSTLLRTAGLAASLILALTAQAQNKATTLASNAAAPLSQSTPQPVVQRIKNPRPWLNWGADLRLRNEYFDNLLTLNPDNPLHEQDYFRFRARLWAALKPVEDATLNVRLATEPRQWMNRAGYSPMKGNRGWDWTEGIVDTLNVQWRDIFGLPVSMTVGRQDLVLGEGWLVLEGTPNDGSATVYLDAAKFTCELQDLSTTVNVIGIRQYAQDDEWLPTMNNQNRFLADQDETGAILYLANKSLPAVNADAYFMYKHDNRLNDPALKYGDNADIYTLGARLSGILCEHWKYSVEGAAQSGDKQDPNVKHPSVSTEYRDIHAFGLNSKLSYRFQDTRNHQLHFSFELLSGDDPDSTDDEMFDVLWGRWPRWSEIGLYSFAAETRVGQEANILRFGPGWTCDLSKRTSFSANYYALYSPEEIPTREASATLFGHTGNFRGHFVDAVLKHKFNTHLSGHLWSECLFPGDYYVHQSPMPFLRAELMLVF